MGFYERQVLPRMLDLGMGGAAFRRERAKCLAGVQGRVLEVGFGSGHNLPFYPAGVEKVVGVDPSGQSAKLASKRIAQAPFPVEFVALPGERIDAPDASVDAVVTTFSLCTIPEPSAALAQMLRVLRPGGQLYFLEHGLADDEGVVRWQNRLNGIQSALFGGCNLNRPIDRLVQDAGFVLEQIERYYGPGPRPLTYLYRGVARRG